MDFFRPFRENKRHERASGAERGRKRAEEAEENPAMEAALAEKAEGIAPGRQPGIRQGPGRFWSAEQRGSEPPSAPRHRAGRAGLGGRAETQLFACFPRPVLRAGISFSLKPFPIDKALSDALPRPLMSISLYLPLISQERRPGSVPESIPGKPGARETPCDKRRRISFSLFIYSEKKSFY